MLVIKQFGPVTYAMGTLQEILAGTGIAAKVRAVPEDVAGCTLEMGADGLWTGNLGTLTQAQFDALYTDNLASGVTWLDGGILKIWSGSVSVLCQQKTPIQSIRDIALRNIVWWGDSTVEIATGNGLVPYIAGPSDSFNVLPGYTLNTNYGANGYSTSAILSATPGSTNGGGNIITPEGVGSACSKSDLLVLSFGINELRINSNVAIYGSDAMISAVKALQGNIVAMIGRVRTIAHSVPVVFMVPNTLCLTGPLIVGPTGQNVTDALRAAYIGDLSIGVPSLDYLVSNSAVCDSGAACFGVVSPVTANKPNTISDELHPNIKGLAIRQMYVAEWLNSICLSDEYQTIAAGSVISSTASYMDLKFIEPAITLFGNSSGTSYGLSTSPAIGVGDELLFTLTNGLNKKMRLRNPPYVNSGYLRWISPPDGSWHASDIPAGSSVRLIRRKSISYSDAIAKRLGYTVYPFRITAGAAGSLTIRGISGVGVLDLANRAPTNMDWLGIPSAGRGEVAQLGIPLTGATITAGTGVGAYNIALPGTDFVSSVGQLGTLLVQA